MLVSLWWKWSLGKIRLKQAWRLLTGISIWLLGYCHWHFFYWCPCTWRLLTGFSIWRLDNAVGSFYAHATVEYPTNISSCDLHQILFRSPSLHISSMNNATSKPSVSTDCKSQEQNNHSSSSPGWDVLKANSRASDCTSTPHFERIWWDKGSDLRRPVSIWRPLPRSGFSILGDCIIEGLDDFKLFSC